VGWVGAGEGRGPWPSRKEGAAPAGEPALRVYTTEETHTWIHKAADLFGLGTDAIRFVPTDRELRMDVGRLEALVSEDRAAGRLPFLVVGSGGARSTGARGPPAPVAPGCPRRNLLVHRRAACGRLPPGGPGAPRGPR